MPAGAIDATRIHGCWSRSWPLAAYVSNYYPYPFGARPSVPIAAVAREDCALFGRRDPRAAETERPDPMYLNTRAATAA